MAITFLNAQGWPEVSGTTPEAHALSAATPTPTTIPARAFVVVGYAHQDGATAITALSDSNGAGDTWSVSSGNYLETSGDGTVGIAFGQIGPNALSSSSGAITATYSSNAYQYRQLSALAFSGVAASSPQDGTAKTMAATYTNVATLDSALSYSAGDLVVGVFYQYQTDNQVLTPVAGLSVFSTVESSRRCDIVYGVMSSAGSITKFGTYAAYVSPMGIAVAFKAAASGSSVAGSASVSASGSLTAAGAVAGVALTGAASLAALASMVASAAVTGVSVAGSASVSASATMTAAASVVGVGPAVLGIADLSGAGTLTVAGSVGRAGSVSLSTAGSIEASGAVDRAGSAGFTATSSLTTAGTVIRGASSVDLDATGAFTASGRVARVGSVTLSVSASLTAAAAITYIGSAEFSAVGNVSAIGSLGSTSNVPTPLLPTGVVLDAHSLRLTLDAHGSDIVLDAHGSDIVLDAHETTLALND